MLARDIAAIAEPEGVISDWIVDGKSRDIFVASRCRADAPGRGHLGYGLEK
ncbi:hypothetical protein GCM10011335_53440 [Aureimonas glaciei]|uniref:Uncharacterized protein n=1 Tax=Aureimonas glaciei TaxID=1776957 RepID=A0A916YH12_9HYPH|nr:hypothetical protein GCM10011335_53440 [Aureimonas glaciei]